MHSLWTHLRDAQEIPPRPLPRGARPFKSSRSQTPSPSLTGTSRSNRTQPHHLSHPPWASLCSLRCSGCLPPPPAPPPPAPGCRMHVRRSGTAPWSSTAWLKPFLCRLVLFLRMCWLNYWCRTFRNNLKIVFFTHIISLYTAMINTDGILAVFLMSVFGIIDYRWKIYGNNLYT